MFEKRSSRAARRQRPRACRARGRNAVSGLGEPRAVFLAQPQSILHHGEHSRAGLAHARVALRRQHLRHLRGIHARQQLDAKAHRGGLFRQRRVGQQHPGHGIGAVGAHRAIAATAVQRRHARVQQFQVIVELRHRAHGGARGAHRVALLDGDRRRDAADRVDLRLVHALEELPRIGREGLDVAALALGVDGVEGQRGLARSAHPRDHREFPERKLEAEVAQVVLARAFDADAVFHVVPVIR
ncbi:MAG: hypothetical protein IPM40_17310 [Gammaproteobacteria bacterium]|nr:hypothetical protein [Gammaproteobacteria bacterium]